jgi:hypothetical protein
MDRVVAKKRYYQHVADFKVQNGSSALLFTPSMLTLYGIGEWIY